MKKTLTVTILSLGAMLAGPQVHATLIGDTIDVEWQFPSVGQFFATQNVLVGNGIEIDCTNNNVGICAGFQFADIITFDISASSVTISFPSISFANFAQSAFNGFIFNDLDWIGQAGTVSGVNLNTNIAGLDLGDVGFGANFVSVDFGANSGTAGNFFSGAFVTLNIQTTHAVPEPGTLGLLAIGFLGLFGLARRRRTWN